MPCEKECPIVDVCPIEFRLERSKSAEQPYFWRVSEIGGKGLVRR